MRRANSTHTKKRDKGHDSSLAFAVSLAWSTGARRQIQESKRMSARDRRVLKAGKWRGGMAGQWRTKNSLLVVVVVVMLVLRGSLGIATGR